MELDDAGHVGVGVRENKGERTMERRKFLIGAAGTAVGASALVGSGAFTTAEVERNAKIKVSNEDTDAQLGFSNRVGYDGTDNGRSPYARITGGVLEIDLTASGNHSNGLPIDESERGESGMNKAGATFTYDNIFKIVNNGVSTVCVGMDVQSLEDLGQFSEVKVYGNGTDISDTLNFNTDPVSLDSEKDEATIAPGEELYISLEFETTNEIGGPFDEDVSIGGVDVNS